MEQSARIMATKNIYPLKEQVVAIGMDHSLKTTCGESEAFCIREMDTTTKDTTQMVMVKKTSRLVLREKLTTSTEPQITDTTSRVEREQDTKLI